MGIKSFIGNQISEQLGVNPFTGEPKRKGYYKMHKRVSPSATSRPAPADRNTSSMKEEIAKKRKRKGAM